MSVLDQQDLYQRVDPSGMGGRIAELPAVCERAWREGLDVRLPSAYRSVKRVLVLGMGGSAIGGDLVGDLSLASGGAPVFVSRDYQIPFPVGQETLVVASSYSGNTEETIAAFRHAIASSAPKLVMTTGGKLQSLAHEHHIPIFPITYKAEPRAAIGYSLMPLVAILMNLGLLPDQRRDVEEGLGVLANQIATLGPAVPFNRNAAKQLAAQLQSKVPVIYGGGLLSAAARRWKGQLNENAKVWAFFELLPEFNHNALVGYEFPKSAGHLFVVLLRSESIHPRLRLRIRITTEILERQGVPYQVFNAQGKSPLAQMLSVLLMGDYVSYYLAMLCGVDPSPVAVIDYLKARLAEAPVDDKA
ncbi:MAG: bifunctional phosphoglucose/phosphomannose isomerase [Chloroflexi bacterium]|nr:bifunctional phosphoglucose/phosphomannose isomerase [Chloroflexota bacterium]